MPFWRGIRYAKIHGGHEIRASLDHFGPLTLMCPLLTPGTIVLNPAAHDTRPKDKGSDTLGTDPEVTIDRNYSQPLRQDAVHLRRQPWHWPGDRFARRS